VGGGVAALSVLPLSMCVACKHRTPTQNTHTPLTKMSRKTARDATTPKDASDNEVMYKRPRTVPKVQVCMEPVKEELRGLLEDTLYLLEGVQSSVLDSNKAQVPLTDGDIEQLDLFFARVKSNMDRMKPRVNYRRAELHIRDPQPTGYVYHDYYGY